MEKDALMTMLQSSTMTCNDLQTALHGFMNDPSVLDSDKKSVVNTIIRQRNCPGRLFVIRAAADHGDDETALLLEHLITNETNESAVCSAAWSLSRLLPSRALAIVEWLLSSNELYRRISSLHAIEVLPDYQQTSLLMLIVDDDADYFFRRQAAIRLAYRGSDYGHHILLDGINVCTGYEYYSCICAMAFIGNKYATERLVSLMSDAEALADDERRHLVVAMSCLLSASGVNVSALSPDDAIALTRQWIQTSRGGTSKGSGLVDESPSTSRTGEP